jgi:8-oxo-dGTP diphosphatase
VAVDAVVYQIRAGRLSVLLIRRERAPFAGLWALPGGFVEPDEDLSAAARRELREETGIDLSWMEQLYSFGDPQRDPRGRVISVSYLAIVPADEKVQPHAGDDARQAEWFDADHLPAMAFDHQTILEVARQRLRAKIEYTTLGFQLVGRLFTLGQLQETFECVLGRRLDKRNFRRKLAALNVLEASGQWHCDRPHRPARLYRFARKRFESLRERGILFPF